MKRVLVVGAGGLGSPAALLLARHGGLALSVLDDDVVAVENLHRQTLFGPDDIGRPKVVAAAERLRAEAMRAGVSIKIEPIEGRLVPDVALDLVRRHDVVVEGADNFATKFLTADACGMAGVACAQAGAVRWSGWALGVRPGRGACLRCVFEDIPRDRVETCAEAGVVGPVVGVLGALLGALALRLLAGDAAAAGELHAYDGLAGKLRRSRVRPRAGCPLCAGEIRDLALSRYVPDEEAICRSPSASPLR